MNYLLYISQYLCFLSSFLNIFHLFFADFYHFCPQRRPLPGGRFTVRTGASAAAAVTAGAIALMLEWLLNYENVPGIDSYQIKSLLILGAVRPKTMEYPNREWGYGQLNLYNTFETIRQL